jgi:hypothetical protein
VDIAADAAQLETFRAAGLDFENAKVVVAGWLADS